MMINYKKKFLKIQLIETCSIGFMKGHYYLLILFCCLIISMDCHSQNPVPFKPGSALLPVPQSVALSNQEYVLDQNWLIVAGTNISTTGPAVQSLIAELKERFGLTVK